MVTKSIKYACVFYITKEENWNIMRKKIGAYSRSIKRINQKSSKGGFLVFAYPLKNVATIFQTNPEQFDDLIPSQKKITI